MADEGLAVEVFNSNSPLRSQWVCRWYRRHESVNSQPDRTEPAQVYGRSDQPDIKLASHQLIDLREGNHLFEREANPRMRVAIVPDQRWKKLIRRCRGESDRQVTDFTTGSEPRRCCGFFCAAEQLPSVMEEGTPRHGQLYSMATSVD